MNIKLLQWGQFYLRMDLTIMHGQNVLLGFNYCEGVYKACKDVEMTECRIFDFSEFQIGLLLLTFSIGREVYNPDYE